MFQKLCFGLILLAFGSSAYAQSINFPGKCPESNNQADIDPVAFLGTWQMVGIYKTDSTKDLECVVANYGWVDERNYTFVIDSYNAATHKEISYGGWGIYYPKSEIRVTIPGNPNVQEKVYHGYSDNTNYNLLFSCQNLDNNTHNLMVWLLTREEHPKPEIIEKMYSILKEINIPTNPIKKINHDNCPRQSSYFF